MAKICYVQRRFSKTQLDRIAQCNAILEEYGKQGFTLTLRQLFYQQVARGLMPNTTKSYRDLGFTVSNARLAGLIDWNHVLDRTRHLRGLAHWNHPSDIVRGAADQFRMDLWSTQEHRPEVWIEKDALVGVIEPICNELDVPYFSCRGYNSQSEMWRAAMRLKNWSQGHSPVVLHFGDHDPSGQDMSRDILDRFRMFGVEFDFHRVALNMDQVRRYKPPHNPAKVTDSRYKTYIREYGTKAWELDALEPKVMAGLIRREIEKLITDRPAWEDMEREIASSRELLGKAADRWHDVAKYLKRKRKKKGGA